MRNLKKILALVLALVMSFSIMTVSSATFKDQDKIDETYAEAIEVLSALKVFEGREETGNFDPKDSITRGEVAAIIYRVTTGDVEKKQVGMYADMNAFTDVKSDDWFAGYVNYCASAKYINGRGDGTFDPWGKVTGFEALTMILRAIGYDQNNEFTGPSYTVEVAKVAQDRKITENLKGVTLGAPATREVVAEILFQTIIIPQVKYTLAFGYSIYENPLQQDGSKKENDPLAYDTFGMEKIEGVIEGTYRLAGHTYMDGKTIKNTTTSWENIGYAAHIYAVKTAKPGVYNAITEAFIDGTSMLVSTNGTPYAVLTTYYVPMDYSNVEYTAGYAVYYNGVLVQDETAIKNYLKKVSNVGVKVDFIDNDNAGKADAVVITEYTLAQVTADTTNGINSGLNGTIADSYYLNRVQYYADYVVCDETLVKGEWVTYVEYNYDAYVTKVEYTQGSFDSLTRKVVESKTNEKDYVFTVAGEDYRKSAQNNTAMDVLVKGNLAKTVALGLDPYGYIVLSYIPVDPASFLYVYENEQTKGLGKNKLTETVVVYTDGTVETVQVAAVIDLKNKTSETFFWNTSDDIDPATSGNGKDCIDQKVYQYVEQDGVFYLYITDAFVKVDTAKYEGLAQFGAKGLDNKSTLVDVRPADILAYVEKDLGTVYVGHTGDNEVPALLGAETWSMVNPYNGIIEIGFLVNGLEPEADEEVNLANDFIVYNTAVNKVTTTKNVYGGYDYFYDLSVISGGELVTLTLSETEYEYVDKYGVGHYQISKKGVLSYTAFPEEWVDIEWSNNTLILDGAYLAYGDIPFYVLNIEYGEADLYEMASGEDFTDELEDVMAYVIYSKGVVSEIYVIADAWNLASIHKDADGKLDAKYVDGTKGEYTATYAVVDNAITNVVVDNSDVVAASKAYDKAVENYNKAVKALEEFLDAQTAAAAEEEEPTLTDLWNAVLAARQAVIDAYNKLAAAVEASTFENAALIAKVEAAEETIEDITNEINQDLAPEVSEVAAEIILETAEAFDKAVDAALKDINIVYNVGEDVNGIVINMVKNTVTSLKEAQDYIAQGANIWVAIENIDLNEAEDTTNMVSFVVKVRVANMTFNFRFERQVTATENVQVAE